MADLNKLQKPILIIITYILLKPFWLGVKNFSKVSNPTPLRSVSPPFSLTPILPLFFIIIWSLPFGNLSESFQAPLSPFRKGWVGLHYKNPVQHLRRVFLYKLWTAYSRFWMPLCKLGARLIFLCVFLLGRKSSRSIRYWIQTRNTKSWLAKVALFTWCCKFVVVTLPKRHIRNKSFLVMKHVFFCENSFKICIALQDNEDSITRGMFPDDCVIIYQGLR